MLKNTLKITLFCLIIFNFISPIYAQRLFGLTIDESALDDANLHMDSAKLIDNIIAELRKIKSSQPANNPLAVRIVLPVGCEFGGDCDPSETKEINKLDRRYLDLIKRIKGENLATVMTPILDSDVQSSTQCFKNLDEAKSVACFLERTTKLYEKLGKYVDIWEIGNEINGDWFGGKVVGKQKNFLRRKIIVSQIKAAYDFLTAKKLEIQSKNSRELIPRTAITYYFSGDKNRVSYEDSGDEMLGWIRGEGGWFGTDPSKKINFPNLDYAFVSYYPDDNFYSPPKVEQGIPIYLNGKDWAEIFAAMQTNIGPNTKFGIGEMGTQCKVVGRTEDCNQCNECRNLLLDPESGERNPCDKYDAKGNVIETRNCPCCLCSQAKVFKEYYTDLDKQIRMELKNDPRFRSADKFVGGYFNWYYAEDVINKTVVGSPSDRLQADKVRNALIEAFRDFGR